MASPFSGLVLGSGALLASPALKDGFVDGTLPIETAVMRLFVAVLVSWIGFSLLGSLLEGTGGTPQDEDGSPALPAPDGTLTVRGAVVDSDEAGQAKG